jgi:putative transposase
VLVLTGTTATAERAPFRIAGLVLTPQRRHVLTGFFWTGLIGRIDLERKEPEMARGKRFSPEQIIAMLRQIEVQLAQGKRLALACKEAGIAEQSYYRWRREYGGLQLEQAKRLKELERENARLRRLVADLALEKQVLKDVAAGNVVQP